MPTISRGFVDQAQLTAEVVRAASALNPVEVRDVRFSLGTDWSGEPAIFFGILLTPSASRESRLAEVSAGVAALLVDSLQPYNRWGLQPYFNFTSDQGHYGKNDWI